MSCLGMLGALTPRERDRDPLALQAFPRPGGDGDPSSIPVALAHIKLAPVLTFNSQKLLWLVFPQALPGHAQFYVVP